MARPTSRRVFVNFPLSYKFIFDMVHSMRSNDTKPTMVTPGTELRQHDSLKDVDFAIIPRELGGDAVSVDADGKEDAHCVIGVSHPTWSQFLAGLVD